MTAAAERLTLLSRPSRSGKAPQRYHPLVREFLEARLLTHDRRRPPSPSLHRQAAVAAALDWRMAAYHFRQAGDAASVASTIAAAIPEIMGGGQHAAAIEEIDRLPDTVRLPVLDLVDLTGQVPTARLPIGHRAIERRPGDRRARVPGERLCAAEPGHASHRVRSSRSRLSEMTRQLDSTTSNDQLRQIAVGAALMIDATGSGSLDEVARHLTTMAEDQRGVHSHYFGVTMLNLALLAVHQDRPELGLEYAKEAIWALGGTSSRIELSAAYMALAQPLALLGRGAEANDAIDHALELDEAEAVIEQGELADSYLDPDSAWAMLASLDGSPEWAAQERFAIQSAVFHARRGRFDEARGLIPKTPTDNGVLMATATLMRVAAAYVAVASDSGNGFSLAREARQAAKAQGATRWRRTAELLEACAGAPEGLGASIVSIGHTSPWNLTFVADLIASRLDDVGETAVRYVAAAAELHPGRWRFALRNCVSDANLGQGLTAARLLEGDRRTLRRRNIENLCAATEETARRVQARPFLGSPIGGAGHS